MTSRCQPVQPSSTRSRKGVFDASGRTAELEVTEGFDTLDLKEAGALLEELA